MLTPRYRVQYTLDGQVHNAYFHSLTTACDAAALVGRALVIDQDTNAEVYYHAERKVS